MSRHVFDELTSAWELDEVRRFLGLVTVGSGFGRRGMKDDELCRELRGSLKTFHTKDAGFFRPRHVHPSYSIIWYDVPSGALAPYVRRILRHHQFNTHAKRLGKVVRVAPTHIECYTRNVGEKINIAW